MLKGGKNIKNNNKRNYLFIIVFLIAFSVFLFLNLFYQHHKKNYINPYLFVTILFCIVSIIIQIIMHKNEMEETKIAQNSSDSMKTLINNLDNGIIELNSKGEIILYNASSLIILDTNKTLTGLNIEDVMPLKNTDNKNIDIKNKILNSKRINTNDNYFYQQDENEKIRLRLTISPIKNNFGVNEQNNFLLIFRDITKEKNLEEQKDEFVSVISHELRTPITISEGALSNLDILLQRGEIDKIKFKKLLDKSHKQVVFLADMVNDLSSLRRAQSQQEVEIEKVNLRDFANELYDSHLQQVNEKGLALDLDLKGRLGTVETNEFYLREIIQNLLGNAIKYTKKGNIKLTIEKNNLNTIISVKDSGIGISKSDQTKVFDKFFRSEDFRTRESGGTGLGLYVSYGLAKRLNGELSVKSRINFGSTFTLKLPNKIKLKK